MRLFPSEFLTYHVRVSAKGANATKATIIEAGDPALSLTSSFRLVRRSHALHPITMSCQIQLDSLMPLWTCLTTSGHVLRSIQPL